MKLIIIINVFVMIAATETGKLQRLNVFRTLNTVKKYFGNETGRNYIQNKQSMIINQKCRGL